MTAKAREVLSDCRLALTLLEDDTDNGRWRVHWAAAVALVRAVGHVLKNVDAADESTIARVIDSAHKRWKSAAPEHEIFREFIEKERNNLLKEYSSAVYPLSDVALAFEITAQSLSGGEPISIREFAQLDENIYRPMTDGPWEGDDARDVLTAAIDWWEQELTAIDAERARSLAGQPPSS